MSKKKKNQIFTEKETKSEVDDRYKFQKRYMKTRKGKKAMKKAREAYDSRDPERRKKQKREYMKRMRAEKKAGLRDYI